MRNYSGVRYIDVGQFVKFCDELNVPISKDELEHYEKSGILLPTARVHYPQEYQLKKHLWSLGELENPEELNQWPDLEKIWERRVLWEDYAGLPDEELLDPFDREIDTNPHLKKPKSGEYLPWKSYEYQFDLKGKYTYTAKSVEHYYSHWQIFHIKFLQKYPDLYQNRMLISHLPSEAIKKLRIPRALNSNLLSTFNNTTTMFDMLSLWTTVHKRIFKRTFGGITEVDRVRKLNQHEWKKYKSDLDKAAKRIQDQLGFDVDALYTFLITVVQKHMDYIGEERFKLARVLKDDIIYLGRLINSITGADLEDIGDELGRRSTYWHKNAFRHLDIPTKERDDAIEMLERYSSRFPDELKALGISGASPIMSKQEIEDLLDFCEEEGLTILTVALSGMTASAEEVDVKFRRSNSYSNLKNLLSALEFLLRKIADKKRLKLRESTLKPLISQVMKSEPWLPVFESYSKSGRTRGKSPAEFLANLLLLLQDKQLVASENDYWARAFLITSLGRNLTVHLYPNEDWFYGEKIGEFIQSAVHSILFTWKNNDQL